MKKLLFALLALLAAFTACDSGSGGDTPKSLVLTGGTSTSQTIYADETQKSDGIRFTAVEDWAATVNPAGTKTAGSNVDWLTLSQYEGGAGEFSLSITLQPNGTGEDRKAEIKIVSGSTSITITVEQKGYKKDEKPEPEDPEDPEGPEEPLPVYGSVVEKITYEETSDGITAKGVQSFKYDDKLRLVEMTYETTESYTRGSSSWGWTDVYTLSYGDGTISYEYSSSVPGNAEVLPPVAPGRSGSRAEMELQGIGSCVLDKAGRAVSGTYKYRDEKDDTWDDPQDYTLKYNGEGYLIECNGGDSPDDRIVSQWSNGNLTEVWWGKNGSNSSRDWAVYGATPNNGHLDITPFLLNYFEGFAFSAGDPEMLFTVIGRTGKRSAYMPVKAFSKYESQGGENQREYQYKTNDAGYVIQIVKTDNNKEGQNKRTYNITYRK